MIQKSQLVIICLVTAWIPFTVQSQNRNDRTISCSSTTGERTFCKADTDRYDIRMSKQLGDTRCIEGYNWGRDQGGVWVNRGCKAEFSLLQDRRHIDRSTTIEAGDMIPVRTNETVTANRADGRVFTGIVDEDVQGTNGHLAIPRGSQVELIVRVAHDQDLILDLDSVMVDGQRYSVDATPDRVESKDGIGSNERTGRYVGGGAILGAIVGAIAGGGKGAAIGAGVGAAGGAAAQVATKGRDVRVPSESLVTFRLDHPLTMGIADNGSFNDGAHYHNYDNNNGNGR